MDTLRNEVKSELINQAGRYNPNDRDVNVRIVRDIRVAIDELVLIHDNNEPILRADELDEPAERP